MNHHGPGKVCLNEQTWKEVGLEPDWHLFLQELNVDELPEPRYCVMVRHYLSIKNLASPQEILFHKEFSLAELKTKVCIPCEFTGFFACHLFRCLHFVLAFADIRNKRNTRTKSSFR